jgi:cyclopropane fatty-acyl-phospholipid synthase-like methyltransferase
MARIVPVVLALSAASVGCAQEPALAPAADGHHHHHDHGGPLVHRFENAAQWAKDFDDPARDAWQHPAEVIAALKITPGLTVADLGAGTGYFLPHLARAVGPKGKVLGLDIEPDMVRYMKERAAREGLANVEPRVVPLDDPQLPAGGVDRILIVDTWHHIDGRPAYVAKLRAALAPGGAVFIVDFKKDAHRGPPPEHRLGPEQVAAELRQGGLVPEVVEVGLPEQYIVLGRRP